ncbi:MAG: hypothetical protein L3J02_01930, partial [Henriciella sp.]|nr:hypothetical protein [Henriciella sp.]
MAMTTKTPTRILTLIALFLAAGVLSIRAADLFPAPAQAPQNGSTTEQSLINLLEPVAGAGNIRVSIHGRFDRTVLVLINGPQVATAASEATTLEIETITKAALALDTARETLTLSQFPFADRPQASLSSLEMAELVGLGLLCALLTVMLIAPPSQADAGHKTPPQDIAAQSGNLRIVKETPAAQVD